MRYTAESIGSRLIESFTLGLYDGNLNCLREYVQNGVDSGAKNIEIYFEGKNNLIVKDDGAGMDAKELELALNIGVSTKSGENVGWRGIGIWSGVSACRRIILITKKCNNNKYRVEINNDVLRSGSFSDKPFLAVFEEATGEIEALPLGKDESQEKDHFTEIRLESILKTQNTIFSQKAIKNYLSSTIPAPLNELNFSFAKEVNRWLEDKNVIFSDVNISFENEKVFRYPDRSDIFYNKIIKKDFIVRDKLIAAGWFITSRENKVIPAPNGGIYFKKKGFTIGDANLIEKLNINENYSRWQYGEIHIISKDLRENAARNNFEYNNPYIEDFQKDIGTFISELQNVNRYQSVKIQTKLITNAKEALKNGDFSSAEQALSKAIIRMSKSRNYPSDQALQGMKKAINDAAEQNIQDIVNLEQELKSKNPEYKGDLSEFIEKARNSIKKSLEQTKWEEQAEENQDGEDQAEENQEEEENRAGEYQEDANTKENAADTSPESPIEEALIEPTDTTIESLKGDAKSAEVLGEKNEPLWNAVKRNLSPAVKEAVARSTSKGLEHLEMSATDPIRDILKEKTGLHFDQGEIARLSQAAYGWGDVTSGKRQILALDKYYAARNWRFGAMIYTVHDLLVNIAKHETGEESFRWFEEASPEEKKTLIAEIYAMIDFIYRLIEKSEYNN